MQRQQQKPFLEQLKDGFNVMRLLCGSCAALVWPLFRRRQGRDMPGFYGLGALLVQILVAGFANSHELLRFYTVGWLILLCLQRASSSRYWDVTHSKSEGLSWMLSVPGCKGERDAKLAEIAICLLAGGLLWHERISVGIGATLVAAGVGLAGMMTFDSMRQQRIRQQMVDAEWDMQFVRRSNGHYQC